MTKHSNLKSIALSNIKAISKSILLKFVEDFKSAFTSFFSLKIGSSSLNAIQVKANHLSASV